MTLASCRRCMLLSCAALSLFGCGPEDASQQSTPATAVGAITPVPTPSPSPATTSAGTGVGAVVAVADGLNASTMLDNTVPVATSNAPDVVGAFRFLCPPSHISYDDPIMHPGAAGANEHLHIFFGNTKTDANSTYESLRTSGDGTCRNALNRSAYWQPAMLGRNAAGQDVVVVEDFTDFYYKRRPADDPGAEGIPVPLPRGLRFVFGGLDQPARFKCVSADEKHNVTDWLPTMQQALSLCSVGEHLDIAQSTPECWDGKNLDSPDHRSHLVFLLRDANTGKEYCPSTHPYLIPRLHFQRFFTIRSDDVTSSWRLSSDMAGDTPGASAHADYIMAWNDNIMDRWMAACINKLLTCSDGNLGDGAKMIPNTLYKNAMAAPGRRVPVPSKGEVVSLLLP